MEPERTGTRMSGLDASSLLLLGAWLGAALLFSFVVAPAAFAVVPTRDVAGALVQRVFRVVNIGGFIIGLLLLLLRSLRLRRGLNGRAFIELVALLTLVIGTGIGNWVIAARMRAIRLQLGMPVDLAAISDPLRLSFNSLHGYSVTVLSIAMLAALAAWLLCARSTRIALQ